MEETLKYLPMICIRIEEIEGKRQMDYQVSRDWVEEITDPEFQLLDNLLNLLVDTMTSATNKEKILHVLRCFLSMSDDAIKEQLMESTILPSILSKSLISSDKIQLNQDLFFIIGKILNSQNFAEIITNEFIFNIFNKLNSIEDDEIFTVAIEILIEISSIYPNINDNPFLTVYHEHPNARLLNEVLLRFLNNETSKEKMYKILYCIMNIMDREGKTVFYSSDLETFLDIALSKLQSTYTEELKLCFIDVLQRITFYEEYYTNMYKINELTDLMEDYASNEEQSDSIKNKSQKVLDNLVKHLQKKLKEVEDVGNDDDEEEREDDEEGEYEEEEEDEGD